MKTLCSRGHKISSADLKALDAYLLVTPGEWAKDALKGMINKSIKTIIKDYLEIFKTKSDKIPANYSQIIAGILAMAEFKPYGIESGANLKPQRKEICNIEIWQGGFQVEDYEYAALYAYYKDPEQTLYDFMDNKIALRKEAFVKEQQKNLINDPKISEIPSHCDDLINLITSKSDYKDRKAKEK